MRLPQNKTATKELSVMPHLDIIAQELEAFIYIVRLRPTRAKEYLRSWRGAGWWGERRV